MFHVHLGGGPSQHPGARGVHLHPLHPLQTCLQKFSSNTMPIGSMHGKKCLHFTLKKINHPWIGKKKTSSSHGSVVGMNEKNLIPVMTIPHSSGSHPKTKKTITSIRYGFLCQFCKNCFKTLPGGCILPIHGWLIF